MLVIRNEGLATFVELETNVKPTLTCDGFEFDLNSSDSSDAVGQYAQWNMRYAGSGVQKTIETYIANARAKRAMTRSKSLLENKHGY